MLRLPLRWLTVAYNGPLTWNVDPPESMLAGTRGQVQSESMPPCFQPRLHHGKLIILYAVTMQRGLAQDDFIFQRMQLTQLSNICHAHAYV